MRRRFAGFHVEAAFMGPAEPRLEAAGRGRAMEGA